ncbi:zinc-ribbon domain-containing protein [Chloroflexota bacterium]
MVFDDKTIQCSDCGTSFTFSAGEQEFFNTKGFTNEPKRCPECRRANKAKRSDNSNNSYASRY